MRARRLRRRYQDLRTEAAWEEYRAARNFKGRLIKELLRRNHQERVRDASGSVQGSPDERNPRTAPVIPSANPRRPRANENGGEGQDTAS
jgi:hypothetical protein